MLAYHLIRDAVNYTNVDKANKDACCGVGPNLCKEYYDRAIISDGVGYKSPAGGNTQ